MTKQAEKLRKSNSFSFFQKNKQITKATETDKNFQLLLQLVTPRRPKLLNEKPHQQVNLGGSRAARSWAQGEAAALVCAGQSSPPPRCCPPRRDPMAVGRWPGHQQPDVAPK